MRRSSDRTAPHPATLASPGDRRRVAAAAACGFTLVELLAVLSILTVLMGLGVGFLLRRGSPMEQAVAVLRDQVRLAAVSAKSRGAPTEVLVLRHEGDRLQLRVRGLEPVAAWHCERGEQPFHEHARGDVRGTHEPGRFGMALRPDLEQNASALRVPTRGHAIWDLADGFLLRLDLRLDERAPCTLVQLGRAFGLTLDADGTPEVRLALAAGRQQGGARTVRATAPLPARRWVTIDVVHDGSTLQLVVDGRVVGETEARGAPFQRDGDMFEVSPGQAPVPGLVDEIQMWAYTLAEPVDMPPGTTLLGLDAGLRFLPTGEPESVCEVTLKTGEQSERHRVAPGGVLQ
jgi:prepilin-type N-terminal cleavage/methylation domain-containing protein